MRGLFPVRLVLLAFTACSKLAGFVRGSPRGAFSLSARLPGSPRAFGEGRGGVLFFLEGHSADLPAGLREAGLPVESHF